MKVSDRTSAATTPAAADPPSPSPARRFALTGRSVAVDPATNAYRLDIADIALAGRVIASHYAEPWMRRCRVDTPLTAEVGEPSDDALRTGDLFAALDCARGIAWGYRVADHRVGYVAAAALTHVDD